ncbi:hypothetical protein PG984_016215 [Apiospora sp. TS-2023a]
MQSQPVPVRRRGPGIIGRGMLPLSNDLSLAVDDDPDKRPELLGMTSTGATRPGTWPPSGFARARSRPSPGKLSWPTSATPVGPVIDNHSPLTANESSEKLKLILLPMARAQGDILKVVIHLQVRWMRASVGEEVAHLVPGTNWN